MSGTARPDCRSRAALDFEDDFTFFLCGDLLDLRRGEREGLLLLLLRDLWSGRFSRLSCSVDAADDESGLPYGSFPLDGLRP